MTAWPSQSHIQPAAAAASAPAIDPAAASSYAAEPSLPGSLQVPGSPGSSPTLTVQTVTLTVAPPPASNDALVSVLFLLALFVLVLFLFSVCLLFVCANDVN